MVYNKLVRDRIPDIIRAQGEIPIFRVMEDEEYAYRLREKLMEEVQEFQNDENLEELADILEVVFALAESLGYSKEELMACCKEKHERRGGFQYKILLLSKEG